MMFDYQDLFHVGVRVSDLDAAMAEVGSTMGLRWAEARENPKQALWTPEHGLQEVAAGTASSPTCSRPRG